MEKDPRKRKKLSDHALEMIMRDVLHGMREFSLEMQADTAPAMASTDDHGLSSDSFESVLRSKKR
ncbi:MAG: hypothetical protein AB2536_11340 [Candidatus Thiodiazotropha endolucinida]